MVRGIIRKNIQKKIWRIYISGILIFFLQLYNLSLTISAEEFIREEIKIEEPTDLYARSAVLMDAGSGRILFEKNGFEPLAMASTTKIMTCILALEKGHLDDVVTVSQTAASQPAVRLGAHEGQQFILRDLLYSLMLESHNDSAVVIAEAIGVTVEGFADLMNEKAKELGCTNTYFITANGLDAEDEKGTHHTTAEELAKIMKYCIMDSSQKDIFLKITQTREYEFSDIRGEVTYNCQNHNALLQMMAGALSGKTGFTNDAGYCYVGALESGGRIFIVSLLACGWPNNKGYKWSDTRKLMEYGTEHFHYRNIYKTVTLPDIEVTGGIPDKEELTGRSTISLNILYPESIDNSKEILMLLRDDEEIFTEIEVKNFVSAPVWENQKMGELKYLLDEREIMGFEIVAASNKNVRDIKWCAVQVLERYLFL